MDRSAAPRKRAGKRWRLRPPTRSERAGRHTSGTAYIAYQERVVGRHLLPFLRRRLGTLDRPILDVGCGTGGYAIALAEALDVPVTGIDLSEEDIATARSMARRRGPRAAVEFHALDILSASPPPGDYGLILLRDVIEHLEDPGAGLARLRSLTDDAWLYVTFPPWRGPFAGHQHNAGGFLRLVPYIHALSPALFLRIVERRREAHPGWVEDERRIVANRLTIRRFEAAALTAGWRIAYRRTYLLRPAFVRHGLPIVSNGPLGRLPLIGEALTTGCEYLLRPAPARSGKAAGDHPGAQRQPCSRYQSAVRARPSSRSTRGS